MHPFKVSLILLFTLFITTSTSFATDLIIGRVDTLASFSTAQNKFALANTGAAHDDFKHIIETSSNKDFYLLNRAITLAEYGFFDLTDAIFSKIDDYEIAQNYIKDIKFFYYPAQRLNEGELIHLAEAYSNIKYNNYAQETVLDIVNNNKLIQNASDYTYYILALGYFETKDYNQALNYITLATSRNPNNINYKITKLNIFLELKEYKKAEKLLKELLKIELNCKELRNKIAALEQFYLYKTEKNELQKNYHLGFYYLLEGKHNSAQRVLTSSVSNNKKMNGQIYNLLAHSYIWEDMTKADEYATKAIKSFYGTSISYYIQAVTKWKNNHPKQALKTLNKGKKLDKNIIIENAIAEIYHKTGKSKQAYKMLTRLCKKSQTNNKALYYLSFYADNNAEQLLKRALSYDINYTDAYYQLALIYANRENFVLAKEYINNVKYICGVNFKYYYYLSYIETLQGNDDIASEYKAKCKELEPNYRDIIDKELQIEE